jgi:alkylated DNA repair protein alkB family protein 7
MLFAQSSKRYLSTLIDVKGKRPPRDFSLFRDIFTVPEQRILLATALQQLDSIESRHFRRRRQAFIHDRAKENPEQSQDLRELFLPDEYYEMKEVHSFISSP